MVKVGAYLWVCSRFAVCLCPLLLHEDVLHVMADWLNNADATTRSIAVAATLLRHYTFDMAGQTIGQTIATWAQQYPVVWLRSAVIEALYQGRYKAVSVQQILSIWQRRSRPLCHFNGEFERMVCSPVIDDHALDAFADALAVVMHVPTDSHPSSYAANARISSMPIDSRFQAVPPSTDSFPSGHSPASSEPGSYSTSTNSGTNNGADGIQPFPTDAPPSPLSQPGGRSQPGKHEGDRLSSAAPPPPIHSFVTREEVSQRESIFYQRLRAFAQDSSDLSLLLEPPSRSTPRIDEWAEDSLIDTDPIHSDPIHSDPIHSASIHVTESSNSVTKDCVSPPSNSQSHEETVADPKKDDASEREAAPSGESHHQENRIVLKGADVEEEASVYPESDVESSRQSDLQPGFQPTLNADLDADLTSDLESDLESLTNSS